jgi:hypothetical protein
MSGASVYFKIYYFYIRIFPTRFIRFAVQQQQQIGEMFFMTVYLTTQI